MWEVGEEKRTNTARKWSNEEIKTYLSCRDEASLVGASLWTTERERERVAIGAFRSRVRFRLGHASGDRERARATHARHLEVGD